jgi:hypothetical protein
VLPAARGAAPERGLWSADSPIIGDDPRAPVEVDEMLLCESCLAIVDHVMTDLKKKVGILVSGLSGRRLAAVPRARDPPAHLCIVSGQSEESRSCYHWAAGRRL